MKHFFSSMMAWTRSNFEAWPKSLSNGYPIIPGIDVCLLLLSHITLKPWFQAAHFDWFFCSFCSFLSFLLPSSVPFCPTWVSCSAMRLWQEQMLKSRQLVLQQQAKSAAAAASKSQREARRVGGCGWAKWMRLLGCMHGGRWGGVRAAAAAAPVAAFTGM
jgi:hypothetical protein